MIRQLSPLPYIDEEGNLHHGLLRKVPPICSACRSRSCAESGYALKEAGQLKTCIYDAFYVYMIDGVGEPIVWCGFLVRGVKYPANHKQILRDGIELDKESLGELATLVSSDGPLAAAALDFRKRGQSQALHDLKHLITALVRVVERGDVKEAQEAPNPTVQEVQLLQRVTTEVYQILGAIKNQIELSDFITAPEIAEMGEVLEIDIYGLFFKNVSIYNVLANPQGKNIDISSVGKIYAKRSIRSSFTLLPAILLDNAIKYSTKGNSISVRVSEQNGKIVIAVQSWGATIPEERQHVIWEEGGRFAHADLTERPGSGFGLFLAKRICDTAGFSISYRAQVDNYRGSTPFGLNQFILSEQ